MEGELAETVITCAKGILRPNRRSTETQWYLSSCPSLRRTGPARHGWLQQASCRARFSVVLRAGGGGTGCSGDAVPEESSSAAQWVSGFALRGPWSLWFFPARPALKKRSHDPFDPAATSQIFGGVKTPRGSRRGMDLSVTPSLHDHGPDKFNPENGQGNRSRVDTAAS